MKKLPVHWCSRCNRADHTTVCRFCKGAMPQRGNSKKDALIGLALCVGLMLVLAWLFGVQIFG